MGEVTVHRLRYVYSGDSPYPNIDTNDQKRLAELLNDGWQVHSHSVVSLGELPSSSALGGDRTVAYEAHLLLTRGGE